MAILDATAQEIVTMTRSECGRQGAAALAAAGGAGPRPDRTAADIAEAVMGSDAWDKYKNSAYKSMTGPRTPEGSTATKKLTKERKLKLKGSLVGWSLQHEPQHFAGEDTHWSMDQPLTWLPSNGDVNAAHLETLGNMISEAFYQHKNKVRAKINNNAKKIDKQSSTAAEASDWNGVTSVHGTDFFTTKK